VNIRMRSTNYPQPWVCKRGEWQRGKREMQSIEGSER